MIHSNIAVGSVNSATPPDTNNLFAWKDPATGPDRYAKAYVNQGDDDGAAYGRCVFIIAARWARAMENALPASDVTEAHVASVADSALSLADDTEDMGISGNQYGGAVAILSDLWLHGEHLRRWHNAKYSPAANERAGAVVNPAVVTIEVGGDAA